jgi:molecular chaperone GrpE
MSSDKKKKWNRIPIRFADTDRTSDAAAEPADVDNIDAYNNDEAEELFDDSLSDIEMTESAPAIEPAEPDSRGISGGPETAELVATRAELKRLDAENAELRDRLARRQADFENYRKRGERERTETYSRVVADIAAKLLPVLDNLKRALDTESSMEASESDEFRHFLSGVDLIYKQLNGVLEALGVTPIVSVGEPFNPHIHEAVVTEATNEYEPDTVMQEIVAGYRLGDKLIRPALVKVATRD